MAGNESDIVDKKEIKSQCNEKDKTFSSFNMKLL